MKDKSRQSKVDVWALVQAMNVGASLQACVMGIGLEKYPYDQRPYGLALEEVKYTYIQQWTGGLWDENSKKDFVVFFFDSIDRASLPMIAISNLVIARNPEVATEVWQSATPEMKKKFVYLKEMCLALEEYKPFFAELDGLSNTQKNIGVI